MKLALVALLAAVMATPVISIPTPSDAQVLTRGSAPRAARRTPRVQPRLSAAEQDSLYEAQDLVTDLNAEISTLERLAAEAGGMTDEQRTQLAAHTTRRDEAQATVDRLIAKRGY